MRLDSLSIDRVLRTTLIFNSMLSLAGKRIVDGGCGVGGGSST